MKKTTKPARVGQVAPKKSPERVVPPEPKYMACEMDATQAGFLDIPLTGAEHLRARVGRFVLDIAVKDGGLSVRATDGGLLAKGTCHNEVILYPCDHNHQRTT